MTSAKKIILFDFDYTLYDVNKWRELIYRQLAVLFQKDYTVFEKIAKTAYAKTRQKGYFDPQVFAEELIKKQNSFVPISKVLHLLYDQNTFSKCYYDETIDVLKKLFPIAKLGIFSTNQEDFFQKKSKMVEPYFQKQFSFISHDKKNMLNNIISLTKKYHVILVDDLIDILNMAKERNKDITTIWIKRGKYDDNITDLKQINPDFTFSDISGMLSVVS